MEELYKFLSLIRKHRLILIIVPILTVIITYFLVRNLPNSYISQAQVATGIVDETKQGVDQATPPTQQVLQEFSNLVALMAMKKIVDQVSYQLLIHDLSSAKPFRSASPLVAELNPTKKLLIIKKLKALQAVNGSLNLYNREHKYLNDLILSMNYDSESLKGKLQAFRSGESDFIIVQFESENPELSAYVVNTISSEFIHYYSKAVKNNQVRTTEFLRDLLAKKSDSMVKRMNRLKDYKVKNRVLNLDEQSSQLYSRIVDYDNKRQEAVQNTSSYAGALEEIDKKFSPQERNYIEAKLSRVNQDIMSTKDQIGSLYDLYFKNDLDSKYNESIDSLKRILSEQINKSSDAYIVNPLNTKQALIQQKITLEVQLDLSRYSINSLERELAILNQQFDQLVPREADVQRLGMDIDIASKEYLDMLNRYNQSSLESNFEVKLTVVQPGMPGMAQPSKKMLLVILSGMISLFFCVVVIFVLYFIDNSITSVNQLANETQAPVLGELSNIRASSIDLGTIWKTDDDTLGQKQFKNQLRSIRYEIENELGVNKTMLITSHEPGEGKTLLSLSLAYAWQMTNQKVLLIDGNFSNTKADAGAAHLYIEDFLSGKLSLAELTVKPGATVILKNKGGDASLPELAAHDILEAKFNELKTAFDYVIIETAALGVKNQAKEWILYSDAIIGVFKYGHTLSDQKKVNVKYLNDTGIFKGWIMNKVPVKSA